MWTLGNKARSSGRTDGVLNLSDISPAQGFIIIKLETTILIHGFFFFASSVFLKGETVYVALGSVVFPKIETTLQVY